MAAPKSAAGGPAQPPPAPEAGPDLASAPGAVDAPPWMAAGPTGDAMLRLAAIHTACIALSDAAGHLRRTSMLVEAASTAALRDALTAPPGGDGWVLALEGAERTMQSAVAAFTRTSQAAVELVKGTAGVGGEGRA